MLLDKDPIFVDVDGNGYTSPSPRPPFCRTDCETSADCPEGEVCHDNAEVGRSQPGGSCGAPIVGECGLGELIAGPAKTSGSLTVQASEPPLGPAAISEAKATEEASKIQERLKKHALGRLIWNNFVHGFHMHDRTDEHSH